MQLNGSQNAVEEELQDVKLSMQKRIQELENNLEEERERSEYLSLEQDALHANLHRAEDMVADLTCELNILKEQQANESIESLRLIFFKSQRTRVLDDCRLLARAS